MSELKIVNIIVTPTIYKNKFLLIKRKKPPYENLWCMPGGKIEIGEHPQDTIVREIFEETSLKVKFVAVRGLVSEFLKSKKTLNGHFVIWVCETKSATDKIKENEEGEPCWFTKEQILDLKKNIIPSDFEMIKTFFFSKKQNLSFYKSHMHKKGKTYLLEYFGTK